MNPRSPRAALAATLVTLCVGAAACDAPSTTPRPEVRTVATPAGPSVTAPSLTYAAPKRLVAVGDVHGDLQATRKALRLAGAVDDQDRWAGGDLFVVQVGDQLDRGDDDRAILDWFDRLRDEAKAAGGHFIALNGNHEIMNVAWDFRYVTPGSNPPFAEFAKGAPAAFDKFPEAERGRAVAFMPGGVYAKVLAEQPLYVMVGDSLFVHGGVLKKHLDYGLEKLDTETREWLRGDRKAPPPIAVADDGPIWSRHFSAAPSREDCAELGRVLDAMGAKRMVMGHTPQKPKANATCDGRAWRIDCGLARHYGGPINVLEITASGTKVLEP